jgi:hypothetical protein
VFGASPYSCAALLSCLLQRTHLCLAGYPQIATSAPPNPVRDRPRVLGASSSVSQDRKVTAMTLDAFGSQ